MAITFGAIKVETLTAEELAALSAYDLGVALNEVLAAISETRRAHARVRKDSTDAKVRLLRAETTDQIRDAKIAKLETDRLVADVRDRASSLRSSASILQSLIRAATII